MRKKIISLLMALTCFGAVAGYAQEESSEVVVTEETSSDVVNNLHDGCGCNKPK